MLLSASAHIGQDAAWIHYDKHENPCQEERGNCFRKTFIKNKFEISKNYLTAAGE